MTDGTGAEKLRRMLLDARDRGFLGPGPVDVHIEHARGFVEAAEAALGRAPGLFVDLGTGGGIPGLVLALAWPAARGLLVESATTRARALRRWRDRLDLARRVDIAGERAELVARDPAYRERAELVTARSFAAPSATAEIASGLVAVDGVLVVSEPPEPDPTRWPTDALAELGFGPAAPIAAGGGHFAVLWKIGPAPISAPRGVGRPAKRPLW